MGVPTVIPRREDRFKIDGFVDFQADERVRNP